MKKKQLIALGAIIVLIFTACKNPFYPEKGSDDVSITSASVTVTGPSKGSAPVSTATANGEGYTCGSVSWSPADNPFNGGTVYTATVTLTANDGYSFADALSATINGNSAAVSGNTGSAVTLSFAFAATNIKTVTELSVKTQPTKMSYDHGDTLDLNGIVVTVAYDDNSSEDVSLDGFASKNISTVPAHNSELSHSTHNNQPVAVSCGEVSAQTNNLTVNKAVVNDVEVLITGPAKDGVPDTTATADGEGYTCGSVSWSPNDNPFKGSTVYTATVTLMADADHAFASSLTAAINGDTATVANNTTTAVTLSLQFDETLAKDVTGISIKTQPTNLSYTHGQTLNLAGLVVTLTFDDNSTQDFALANFGTNISAHPANGAELHHSTHDGQPVAVSFGSLPPAHTSNLTVAKANPNVTWPTGLTASYGQTLSNISLVSFTNPTGTHGAFSWTALSSSVGAIGTQPHSMTFTPNDTENFNTVTQNVNITVSKANPAVNWPAGLAAIVGQTLSNISLTSFNNSGGTPGAFSWTTPSSSVGALGTQSHNMTFTPTDTANYNTVTDNVNIMVVEMADLVWVNGGTFQMGQNGDQTVSANVNGNITPVHTVTVSDFYMGRFEVTQELYNTVMTGNTDSLEVSPSNLNGSENRGGTPEGEVQGRRPVEQVSWYDAVYFCNRLSESKGLQPVYTITGISDVRYGSIGNATVTADWTKNGYRLPTEAEWEYAAKGGTLAHNPPYIWAGVNVGTSLANYAWYSANASSIHHEVGKKQPNELGLYDMTGNVREWCWDWFDETYPSEPQTNPRGAPSGSNRVMRSGYWFLAAEGSRNVLRSSYPPYDRQRYIGFRVARNGE